MRRSNCNATSTPQGKGVNGRCQTSPEVSTIAETAGGRIDRNEHVLPANGTLESSNLNWEYELVRIRKSFFLNIQPLVSLADKCQNIIGPVRQRVVKPCQALSSGECQG